MDFYIFQSACRYAGLAQDNPDDHTKVSIVCNKKVPRGCSWGTCDEAHCPYYGKAISDIKIYHNGELIGKSKSGKVIYE